MNLLTGTAPDAITVGGKSLQIKTDFQTWVRFLISCENQNPDDMQAALLDILGGEMEPIRQKETVAALLSWLFGESGRSGGACTPEAAAFDFEADGNVIYCELWEYFPAMMERGITYHEGMEMIKLLLHNEKTMLWHRAFARCGDFSRLSREERSYWQKERLRYRIVRKKRMEQEEMDEIMSKNF